MFNTKQGSTRNKYGVFSLKYGSPYIDLSHLEKNFRFVFFTFRAVYRNSRMNSRNYRVTGLVINMMGSKAQPVNDNVTVTRYMLSPLTARFYDDGTFLLYFWSSVSLINMTFVEIS